MDHYIRVQSGRYIRSHLCTFDRGTLRYLLLNRKARPAYALDMFAEDLERNKVKDLCKQNKWEF